MSREHHSSQLHVFSSTFCDGPARGGGAFFDPAKFTMLAGMCVLSLSGTGCIGIVGGIEVPFEEMPRPYAVSMVSRATCRVTSETFDSFSIYILRCFSISVLYSRQCACNVLQDLSEHRCVVHNSTNEFEFSQFTVDTGKVFVNTMELELVFDVTDC